MTQADEPFSTRIPAEVKARLGALVDPVRRERQRLQDEHEELRDGRPVSVTLSDVGRLALLLGIEQLEEKYGIDNPKG